MKAVSQTRFRFQNAYSLHHKSPSDKALHFPTPHFSTLGWGKKASHQVCPNLKCPQGSGRWSEWSVQGPWQWRSTWPFYGGPLPLSSSSLSPKGGAGILFCHHNFYCLKETGNAYLDVKCYDFNLLSINLI